MLIHGYMATRLEEHGDSVPEQKPLVSNDASQCGAVAANVAAQRFKKAGDAATHSTAGEGKSVGNGLPLGPYDLLEMDSGYPEHVGRASGVDEEDVPCEET